MSHDSQATMDLSKSEFLNACDTIIVYPKSCLPLLHFQIPGYWSRVPIHIFALTGSSSSRMVIVRVLYHLVSLPLPLDLGHVNVVSILGKMRRLVST